MIKRTKDGKLRVTSLTPRPSQLPGWNRAARRRFWWSKRYWRLSDKCKDLIKDLNAVRPDGHPKLEMPKVQGKYLTGFYGELLKKAKEWTKDVEENDPEVPSENPVPFI